MSLIPSGVFITYAEFADAMLATTGFGSACKLVYVDKIQTMSNSVPNAKQKKVMNLQSMQPDTGFKRGDTAYKTVEYTENITLRVYWSRKEWRKLSSIDMADGSVMTIGRYSDLTKINRAVALLIYSGKSGHQELRFEKAAEPIVHGLNDNYLVCFWKRV